MGFMVKRYKLCSLRFDLFYNKDEEFVDPSLKETSDNRLNQVKISKVFHCHGLLLLCVTKEDNTRLVVWNPYLGQTRWIQPQSAYVIADSYAIGYNNNRKSFVDRYDLYGHHRFLEYKIYDFSSNSWKVLDITPFWEIAYYQRGASLKRNTYFSAKEKIVEEGPEPPDSLLCFDFTTERFGKFLPLPFVNYLFDVGALSSLGDEKLAALSQAKDCTVVEIWVTTMIEPNAVSWSFFLVVDMKPHYGFDFRFCYDGASFFIDDDFDTSERTNYEGAAYIIGEKGYVKKVCLGEDVPYIKGSHRYYGYCCPLVCCSSYVPSLAQINYIMHDLQRKLREEEKANQQQAQITKKKR